MGAVVKATDHVHVDHVGNVRRVFAKAFDECLRAVETKLFARKMPGPAWQAMRLGRNHHWGHPDTIGFVKRLSAEATRVGWPGLYVGDIGQARGGPAPGHASHQLGLDVDIWMLPPKRLDLTRSERELESIFLTLAQPDGAKNGGRK